MKVHQTSGKALVQTEAELSNIHWSTTLPCLGAIAYVIPSFSCSQYLHYEAVSCVMCHVSRVMRHCHMSRVTCHMSRVTCHMSCVMCHGSVSRGRQSLKYAFVFCFLQFSFRWNCHAGVINLFGVQLMKKISNCTETVTGRCNLKYALCLKHMIREIAYYPQALVIIW